MYNFQFIKSFLLNYSSFEHVHCCNMLINVCVYFIQFIHIYILLSHQILSQVKTKNTFKDNIQAFDIKKKVNVHAGSEKSSEWTTHSYAEEVWSENISRHRAISRHISTQFLCRVMVRKMVYFSGPFLDMPWISLSRENCPEIVRLPLTLCMKKYNLYIICGKCLCHFALFRHSNWVP